MAERLYNDGYLGLIQEVTPGVALTPTDFGQVYNFKVKTMRNFNKLAPAAGNSYGVQQVTAGLRDHTGTLEALFEPNTAEKLVAMMLTQSSRTGSGPYTGVYALSSNNPAGYSYTIEVSDGYSAQRYFGCQVEGLSLSLNENEWRITPKISAVGSFQGREVSSYTSGSPNVIVLKTDYDPSPTTGLVAGDIIQYVKASGAVTNLVVSVVTNGTTISTTPNTTTITGAAAGDMIRLRALTPSFTMLPPVLWSNTQFCFGATASAALSAAQTRVDTGSTWTVEYPFKDSKGEHRSGDQDPATLLRKPAEATLTIKKYFDGPLDVQAFNNISKSACVIRHYVYSGGTTYEFRVTLNHLVTDDPTPEFTAGEINYSNIKYICQQDSSDNQAFAITILNSNATLT